MSVSLSLSVRSRRESASPLILGDAGDERPSRVATETLLSDVNQINPSLYNKADRELLSLASAARSSLLPPSPSLSHAV